MTVRASNALAIRAALGLAPYQLQQAQLEGQREAARTQGRLSALDALIEAGVKIPGMVNSELDRQAAQQAQDALARGFDQTGGPLTPPAPTTAEGPTQLVEQPPASTTFPSRIPGNPDFTASITRGVPGIPGTQTVESATAPVEVRPEAPPPGPRTYQRGVYDEAQAQLDASGLKGDGRGWWDDEVGRRARAAASVPLAKEIAGARSANLERMRKADESDFERKFKIASLGVQQEHNRATEAMAQASLNATTASRADDRAARAAEGEAQRAQQLLLAQQHDALMRALATQRVEAQIQGKAIPTDVRQSLIESDKNIATLERVVGNLDALAARGVGISGVVDAGGNFLAQSLPFLQDNPTLTSSYQELAALRDVLRHGLFGGALSKGEQASFEEEFPNWWKVGNDRVFLARLHTLLDRARTGQRQYIDTINSNGLTPRPLSATPSAQQQPGPVAPVGPSYDAAFDSFGR